MRFGRFDTHEVRSPPNLRGVKPSAESQAVVLAVRFYPPVEPDLQVAHIAERQHGVISRGQALRIGITRRAISGRTSSGRWEPVHRGVYRIAGSVPTWHQQVMAACLAAGSDAVASHRTAATLWSIPGIEPQLELTVPERRRVVLTGVTFHRASVVSASDRRRMGAIPVTSVTRTLIDLAATLDKDRLEATLDHCLAVRALTVRQLARRLEDMGRNGRKGTGHLAALLADRPSAARLPESQFEVRLLRLLREQKIPAPRCQHAVRLPSGRRVYLDFAYPHARLAIEADSYRYHSSLRDWSLDRIRNNELVAIGWRILPITFHELSTKPEIVIDHVVRALRMTEVRKFEHLTGTKSSEPRGEGGRDDAQIESRR